MAEEIISSTSFQKGIEDFEGDELYDYQYAKLELLKEMAKTAHEPCLLPVIEDLPKKLKANWDIGGHMRVKILRYAHNLGVNLNAGIEWQIDQWMADFRKECFHANIHDPYGSFAPHSYSKDWSEIDWINSEAYLLRREAEFLGLLVLPQSETPFDYSQVIEKHINMSSMTVKSALHTTGELSETEMKITKDKMIERLLQLANHSRDFNHRLWDHMRSQPNTPKCGWNSYFSEDSPEQLNQKGASALLYAAGYLKKAL